MQVSSYSTLRTLKHPDVAQKKETRFAERLAPHANPVSILFEKEVL